jgi:TetR/AcrR family transcriptional regulator, repressor of the ameABC operon
MARPNTDIDAMRVQLLDTVAIMIERQTGSGTGPTLAELAREAGMSPANIYRFFDSKDALYEAVAGRWFAPKIAIMEQVIASDLPAGEKLHQFFARRFILMRDDFDADPLLFQRYLDLGDEHQEIVRGYIDLGDHYLAMIVADCMADGHFEGLSIDQAVSLINLMVQAFFNPWQMIELMHSVTEEKLALVVATILNGLRGVTQTGTLTLAA